MPKGIVAIVGRPNVGKSTLFNRLIEQRKAIIEDVPGVTRDRLYGTCEWNGETFTVVDTGGWVKDSDDVFEAAIREQVQVALDEADVILFMVDLMAGTTPSDEDVADIIRRNQKKNVLLVLNKNDDPRRELLMAEFYGLGLGEMFAVSAMTGAGTGELLDRVAELVKGLPEHESEFEIPKIAIVGRPNVGKSSFVNTLLGKTANIVTPIAGTTRDTLYTRYNAYGIDCYLVDTAGLRRKARVDDNVEFYSVLRTLRAIENCDVALLMLDATLGMEAQDLKILAQVQKHKKGLVILVNKWDLAQNHEPGMDRKIIEHVQERMQPLTHVPILLTSTIEKKRILKAIETAIEVYGARTFKVPTHAFMEYMGPILEHTPPPTHRGQPVRIKFGHQVEAKSPTFVFFANHPRHVREHYTRFLEGKIREQWPFSGWPVSIYYKQK